MRYSRLAQRNYAAGQIEGERRTVRIAAKARGLNLTDGQSARIDGCDDLATLQRWSEAATTATDADGIFR